MKSVWVIATLGACALAFLFVSPKPVLGRNDSATARIVSAANTFLATLDQKQRQAVLFPSTTRSSADAGRISRS